MIPMRTPGIGGDAKKNRMLYPLNVWAISFGCAVGWGAFVMPGTLFLPFAGPVGSILAVICGGLAMLVIGKNFCSLAVKYKDNGGIYGYTREILGHDHAFLAAWTLIITYLAIIWANATAVVLLSRYLFGSLLQWGFHYQVAGFDVFFGEILTTWLVFLTFGLFALYGGRVKRHVYTAFALLLITIVVLLFVSVGFANHHFVIFPPFRQETNPLLQFFSMLMVAPWMFFGYEGVTHLMEDFHFPAEKIFFLVKAAVITGVVAYSLLIALAIMAIPPEYTSWADYIDGVQHMQGLSSLPVFHSVGSTFGMAGIWVLGVAVLSAIATCILGLYRVSASLFQVMAKDGLLPHRFAMSDINGVPRNALMLAIGVSLFVPFLGRTAIVWLVDVITISGSIAYGYVSLCAYKEARRREDMQGARYGLMGIIFSLFFFFCPIMPNLLVGSSLNTESYLLLAVWSTVGFFYYWYVFKHDEKGRYGKSASLCILLMFLNFFSSTLWLRQATGDQLQLAARAGAEAARTKLTMDMLVQIVLIIIILYLLSDIFIIIRRRERLMDMKMMEERHVSLVKSNFLANVSHDVRLPMAAISRYISKARHEGAACLPSQGDCAMGITGELTDHLSRIQSVSHFLDGFMQDLQKVDYVTKASFELHLAPMDLRLSMQRIADVFAQQMREKDLTFSLEITQLQHPIVLCDENRLSRLLLNLVSNAYKFTPSGGRIVLMLTEKDSTLSPTEKEKARIPKNMQEYELRVQDTGIGMSEAFAKELFRENIRENPFAEEVRQGQGIKIVKYLTDLMKGNIKVITAPEEGTEFILTLKLEAVEEETKTSAPADEAEDIS